MSLFYLDYALRNPRHEASDDGVLLEVERAADRSPRTVAAQLLDLSRDGFQLQASAPLEVGEAVAITLAVGDAEPGLRLSGKVRWQQPEGQAGWRCGCEASASLNWETLGELFLAGVLVRDAD
jgi:hypothetical protein